MAVQISSGLVAKLQQALWKAGYFPGLITQVFDDNTVAQLEAYWASKGWALPANAVAATGLIQGSFLGEDNVQDPSFTQAEMTVIGQAYAEKRGLNGAGGWLKKNWLWIAGGVVLVGAGVGGYFWWRHSQAQAMGELGCGCPPRPLEHSGRTSTYRFPSGTKHGHYRASTGRFHQH